MPPTPTVGSRPADVIGALISGPLTEAGFDLEDVSVRRAGAQHVVAVAVDRDGGVDLDAIAEASRLVSALLDEHDRALPGALGSSYTLEVTSRGTDAPLTELRHWRRAVGRLVEVRRRDRAAVVGRVRHLGDGTPGGFVELDVPAGRKKPAEMVRIELADVTRALVQIEFNPPGRRDEFGAGDDDENDSSENDSSENDSSENDSSDGDSSDGDSGAVAQAQREETR